MAWGWVALPVGAAVVGLLTVVLLIALGSKVGMWPVAILTLGFAAVVGSNGYEGATATMWTAMAAVQEGGRDTERTAPMGPVPPRPTRPHSVAPKPSSPSSPPCSATPASTGTSKAMSGGGSPPNAPSRPASPPSGPPS